MSRMRRTAINLREMFPKINLDLGLHQITSVGRDQSAIYLRKADTEVFNLQKGVYVMLKLQIVGTSEDLAREYAQKKKERRLKRGRPKKD